MWAPPNLGLPRPCSIPTSSVCASVSPVAPGSTKGRPGRLPPSIHPCRPSGQASPRNPGPGSSPPSLQPRPQPRPLLFQPQQLRPQPPRSPGPPAPGPGPPMPPGLPQTSWGSRPARPPERPIRPAGARPPFSRLQTPGAAPDLSDQAAPLSPGASAPAREGSISPVPGAPSPPSGPSLCRTDKQLRLNQTLRPLLLRLRLAPGGEARSQSDDAPPTTEGGLCACHSANHLQEGGTLSAPSPMSLSDGLDRRVRRPVRSGKIRKMDKARSRSSESSQRRGLGPS